MRVVLSYLTQLFQLFLYIILYVCMYNVYQGIVCETHYDNCRVQSAEEIFSMGNTHRIRMETEAKANNRCSFFWEGSWFEFSK